MFFYLIFHLSFVIHVGGGPNGLLKFDLLDCNILLFIVKHLGYGDPEHTVLELGGDSIVVDSGVLVELDFAFESADLTFVECKC